MVTGEGWDETEHVFISYVREDAGRVDLLQDRLNRAGITVWRDTSHLWPGQDWKTEIRRAIEKGMAFIACFSEHTERRYTSFQNKELIWAVEEVQRRPPGRVWLLPVRFADCRLPSFDLGPGRSLDSLQWVDLFDDVSGDSAMTRLITSVRYVQNGSKARSAWSGPRSYPSGESRRPREIKAEAYQRGVDLEANVTVSAADLAADTIVSVHFKEGPCSRCQGTGAAAGTDPKVCPKPQSTDELGDVSGAATRKGAL